MKTASFALIGIMFSSSALAQSKDDKRASLRGITQIAFQESGAAEHGGTEGSMAEATLKDGGLRVVDLKNANAAGLPIFNVHCTETTAVSYSNANPNPFDYETTKLVACEGRLLRKVFLTTGEKAKNVYATTWISPMTIASFPRGVVEFGELRENLSGADEQDRGGQQSHRRLLQAQADDRHRLSEVHAARFVEDWREANPGVKPAAPAKKK